MTLVERAVNVADAANVQLALGGTYVSKSQTQLLVQEELEKSKEKEEGGSIKGTFSRIVTHEGFLRDQAECTQRRLDEAELEKLKEEAKEGWRKFNETQKAEVAKWREEKAGLVALKQRVPAKPSEIQMRGWMAQNYPQLQQNKPPAMPEVPGCAEQVADGVSRGPT
ncbi:uncharacterized protein EI90DRAFT_3126984 [Cantharellus anzutake]|uniref:uncharacterized protein n=1 Tax=Cantharellus anzutake TaxID=1750568 RepID=UPI00190434DC|nr:uncharacterized protein EI90DRAFT_3126984 [Cantharellus anzutake]KAF8327623.1 hypothetical protein EI90DRAFT_3126984 [Cantharellus anzutake]